MATKQGAQIVPAVDRLICLTANVGPTANLAEHLVELGDSPVLDFIPSSFEGWAYNGTRSYTSPLNGVTYDANAWVMNWTNYTVFSEFTFLARASDNLPLTLVLDGRDWLYGSHAEVYRLVYDPDSISFEAPAASRFDLPALCNATDGRASPRVNSRHLLSPLHSALHAYLPGPSAGAKHVAALAANAAIVDAARTTSSSHSLRLHLDLAYLTETERARVQSRRLPGALRRARDANPYPVGKLTAPNSGDWTPPATLSWRGKSVLSEVLSQGVAGTCYAFGSAEALTAAWAITNGEFIPVSEQSVSDCAWGVAGEGYNPAAGGNMGIDGGFASYVYNYFIAYQEKNGVPSLYDYPYESQDGYCRAAARKDTGLRLKTYLNVSGVNETIAALARGPVAIAIDASLPAFSFYSGGVFEHPECKSDPDDLDHEVLLVGYDEDSWHIQNSWSARWGDAGFVRISRKYDCGVTTQGTLPIVQQAGQ
jgi:C1A family cysteine protease